jgi:hypothetical protein
MNPKRRSHRPSLAVLGTLLLASAVVAELGAQQLPLSPLRDSGQTVTPAFEGWYPNSDGTFSLSFGYYNRNREQIIEVPIGDDNFFEPGPRDRGQPTELHPQRHWGVFTVTVPADFGEQRIVWTLRNGGKTFAIPGHLQPDWLLDAKLDPASGNRPPVLKLDQGGPEGSGPDGIHGEPRQAKVGVPLEIVLWATDDEVARGSFSRQSAPVVLRWFKHSGPGTVEFSESEPKIDKDDGGRSVTQATFSAPGKYVLRVRANDYSGLSSGGHSQCCWSNAFVEVTVSE